MKNVFKAGMVYAVLIAGIFSVTAACEPAQSTAAKPKASPNAAPVPKASSRSEAAKFKACVARGGLASEKSAVGHVTKVSGVEDFNDVMDTPEVYTDFKGSLGGADGDSANLIASAFADCYDSVNGLVSIYNRDGQLLANGNF